MDEPTTHLDIHSAESLVLALSSYEGTLVFISRDVHFIRKLADRVLHVSAGKAMPYPGGYDYFWQRPAPSPTNAWRSRRDDLGRTRLR